MGSGGEVVAIFPRDAVEVAVFQIDAASLACGHQQGVTLAQQLKLDGADKWFAILIAQPVFPLRGKDRSMNEGCRRAISADFPRQGLAPGGKAVDLDVLDNRFHAAPPWPAWARMSRIAET
ncbi:hypothetical protein Ajs_0934 [Acidovorax sp. JS42]|nr:hypothetical protein Ajs_0934 [Acidovorax sp. JS42]